MTKSSVAILAVVAFVACAGFGVAEQEIWLGMQTGVLLATGIVVYWYSAETERLRIATDEALGLQKAANASSRRANRELLALELRALDVQVTMWLDVNPVGKEHGLYVWLSHLRNHPADLLPHLRRAEEHLTAATRLAAHLDLAEVSSLGHAANRFYDAIVHLDRLTPQHPFWARIESISSDSTVNQAETALKDCALQFVALREEIAKNNS